MAVVRNLMVRAGANFTALKNEMKNTQTTVADFKQSMTKSFVAINAALASVGGIMVFSGMVKDAMKVEGAIASLQGLLGENAKDFMRWANTQAIAYGMSKKDALDFGKTYANLTSQFARNTQETMMMTQELLKASAIIASKSGRTMEDVMDRMRSGMLGNTEAIEDLGVFVNVAMIESTDAFKKFANGKSWLQLSFQVQQQIRYFAILEQVTKKFGTEIADTTSSRLLKFQANLANFKLALGDAFLPILNLVLPSLTRFMNKLATAAEYVAAFMKALFGQKQDPAKQMKSQEKAVSGVASAMQDTTQATNAATKAQKGFLAGFDEINSVSTPEAPTASGGAGGVGATDPMAGMSNSMDMTGFDAFEDGMDRMKKSAQAMADKVRPILEAVGGFWERHKNKILGVLAAINMIFPIQKIMLLTYFYNTNEDFKAFIDKIAAGLMWFKENVINPISEFIGNAFAKAFDIFGLAANIFLENVLKPLGTFFKMLFDKAIKPGAQLIGDVFATAFIFLGKVMYLFWTETLKPVINSLQKALKPAIEAVSAVLTFLWTYVISPLARAIGGLLLVVLMMLTNAWLYLWKNVLKPVVNFLTDVFLFAVKDAFGKVADVLQGGIKAFTGLMNFITGVFTGDWEKAWEGVKDIFKGIFDSLWTIAKAPLNLLIKGLNKLFGALSGIDIDLPGWMGGGSLNFKMPNIPELARGGIVNSPTLAMIGEAGPEMVVPLENTSFVDKLASAVGTAVLAAQNFGSGASQSKGDIVIQIDGNAIAKAIQPYTSKEQTRVGQSILTVL